MLRYYGLRLNSYERAEVSHYPEIWYTGLDAAKIEGDDGASQNSGYDDDNGSYIKVRLMAFYLVLLLLVRDLAASECLNVQTQ